MHPRSTAQGLLPQIELPKSGGQGPRHRQPRPSGPQIRIVYQIEHISMAKNGPGFEKFTNYEVRLTSVGRAQRMAICSYRHTCVRFSQHQFRPRALSSLLLPMSVPEEMTEQCSGTWYRKSFHVGTPEAQSPTMETQGMKDRNSRPDKNNLQ